MAHWAGQLGVHHRFCVLTGPPLLPYPHPAHAASPPSLPPTRAGYDVTITPVTTMPLKSYPAGGWTYYFIDTEAGFPPGNERFTCT